MRRGTSEMPQGRDGLAHEETEERPEDVERHHEHRQDDAEDRKRGHRGSGCGWTAGDVVGGVGPVIDEDEDSRPAQGDPGLSLGACRLVRSCRRGGSRDGRREEGAVTEVEV